MSGAQEHQYGYSIIYQPGRLGVAMQHAAHMLELQFPGRAATWTQEAPKDGEPGIVYWELTSSTPPAHATCDNPGQTARERVR